MTEPVSPELLARVDALFRDRVSAGIAPSSVWGVFDHGGLVASGGHGDRGDGSPPDADTVYRIASCTKSVTAAAVMLLVERGQLDLDAPITDFVPAFRAVRLPTPDAPVPTVRMLLTMSGGFPTDDPWADRQESLSDDAFDAVLRAGILFDAVPGTRFAYSNLGYALLGRVVAVVSGRPYVDVARTEVLEAVGLPATTFSAADSPGFVVRGVRPHDAGWEPLPLTGPGAFSSIGGLFSTVTDLSRWARHLSAAFVTPDATPTGGAPSSGGPVTTQGRRQMQQAMRIIPGPGPRPMGYGFGLFVEEDPRVGPIVSHSGGYPGFSAHMRWSTSTGLGVVAFENATAARVALAATEAHDLLLAGSASPEVPEATLPVTLAAQGAVTRFLAEWCRDDAPGDPATDGAASAVLAPNVAMDVPLDRRRAAVRVAVDVAGAVVTDPPDTTWSESPTHLGWRIAGTRGVLRVEIRLAPLRVGLVQTLVVRAEPSAD
ncbi:serine hydrolase domain-containing protein [Curtobacterium sp. RRHDQ10]|uniref:serine hydrolase domain-containing protein n=1 Tax=Curtobacterium phyllosphaerae TaxID=3413379 RepID=UPI003BF2F49D